VSDSTDTALGSPSRGSGDGDGASTSRARRGGEDRPGRIRNIGTFYRQVIAELRKVIWPTRKELVTYTTVVVFFVLVMVAVVAVFDLAFGKAVLAVFGE
jgi:preprotein translocase subunit SecE